MTKRASKSHGAHRQSWARVLPGLPCTSAVLLVASAAAVGNCGGGGDSGSGPDAATTQDGGPRGTGVGSNRGSGTGKGGHAGSGSGTAPGTSGSGSGSGTSAGSGTGSGTVGSGTAQPGDVVDGSLTIVPSAYVAMAAQLSTDTGIDYRYGPSASAIDSPVVDSSLPTLFERDTPNALPSSSNTGSYTWQVGGPPSDSAGAYSSDWADVVFVADDPTQRVGVTDMQVTTYMFNTFAQLPQLSWTRNGAPTGGLDQFNIMTDKTAGVLTGNPTATGRCGGEPGFCPQSVVAFQNGVLASAGSNTANNTSTTQLPPNKIPTGVAMTNESEFALVTVWDTTALKGQVAVVALGGLCDGCDPYNSAGPPMWYNWWSNWMAVYPGLPNMGDIAFMKILGYIDLPGMAAPTEIAVTTGLEQFKTIMAGGDFYGLSNSPLSSHWQNFTSGGPFYGGYAKGGVAVVISKSEQKVAFIDLAPLFNYVNGIYFSPSVSMVDNLGQGPGQWPSTFDEAPSQVPTVITTISLSSRPTAVKTTLWADPPRAWVATQDGTLHIFSLDGYAPGADVPSPAPSPSAIGEVGTVAGIGRNPTRLAASKGEPDDGNLDAGNQQVVVSARGDRSVSWVRFADGGNSGSVARSFQDSRLEDPIAVEDSDNFANSGFVLSVMDYAGKAARSYRFGPVVFTDGGSCAAPNGCPVMPTGSINVEYGGSMDFPGKPFQLTTSNVP